MQRSLRCFLVLFISMLFLNIQACGGGSSDDGGGGTGGTTIEQHYQSALTALSQGDIAKARDLFSTIITEGSGKTLAVASSPKADFDPALVIPQSYFGRALTNLMLLMESSPITQLLAGFGQSAWKLGTIFGESGYLSRMHDIYKADLKLTVTGPFSETIDHPFGRTRSSAVNSYPNYAKTSTVSFSDTFLEEKISYMSVSVATNIDALSGATISGTCSLQAGDTYQAAATCDVKDGTNTEQVPLIRVGVTAEGTVYLLDPQQSTGSISINALGAVLGDALSLTFNDLTLFDTDDNQITLNGTLQDSVTARDASTDGLDLPFRTICGDLPDCIISQTVSGYRADDAIEDVNGLQALLADIAADITEAVKDADNYFDIPQGLFFGSRDMYVSHADMLLTLGSVYGMMAGLDLMNAWDVDIGLSNMIDANGDFIGDKTAIVDELNGWFDLISTDALINARTDLTAAFDFLAEGLEEVIGGTSGLVSKNATTADFFTESQTLLASGVSSLSGSTAIQGLVPPIDVNLDLLLDGEVDRTGIPYDPFVLDGSSIKVVESFFHELIQKCSSYDLENHQDVKAYSDTVRAIPDLISTVLESVVYQNRIGGKVIHMR